MQAEWGFSPIGLAIGLAFLAPSLLLVLLPPRGGTPAVPSAGRVATSAERTGQIGCLVALAVSGATAPTPWLLPVGAAIALYLGLWLRYLLRGRSFAILYAPLGPIPVPLAVAPVLAFAAAAVWAQSWWVAIATALLATGHLPNSVVAARHLAQPHD